ncbi:MAG TPA: TolC family protein [Candidatus Acidoferrales bacterium]|nr:TolC family protein [Candidatus Acidoferrales bacterium]
MPRNLAIVGLSLALCRSAFAQPPSPPPNAPNAPLRLTLEEAMQRARANSPQILSASINALLAREDTVQAKAALLPTVSTLNQYIYTQQHDGALVFVSNDGTHVYNNQVQVHGDLYAPQKLADWRRSQVAEAVAKAKTEIAQRGLVATVVSNYYAMVSGERKLANAQLSQKEAAQFLDITQKQERGGEVAHSDVVKAEIQFVQRQRDSQEAQLALDKARIGFAVVLFPDYRQDFTVVDDLDTARPLPPYPEIQTMAGNNSPDIRAAQATVEGQRLEVKSARAAMLPSLSFDYFYGMNSTELALHTRDGQLNLGSAAQAQLNIPIWNWGGLRSKVKQEELRLQQARNDLTLTQRQLLANLDAFYREADAANSQVASLRHSLDLAADSLKLTLLRYTAGEVTVLEVVDAQTTLVQARNAFDDGMVRYRFAIANLQTLTGAFSP